MVEINPSIVRGECTEQDSSAESDRYWRLPWIGNFDYRLAGSLLADLKQSSQNQTEIGHFFWIRYSSFSGYPILRPWCGRPPLRSWNTENSDVRWAEGDNVSRSWINPISRFTRRRRIVPVTVDLLSLSTVHTNKDKYTVAILIFLHFKTQVLHF